MERLHSRIVMKRYVVHAAWMNMEPIASDVLYPYPQAWRPEGDEVDQDAGHETLAEQLAMEALACPQGSAAKPYVAALCKVRCSARVNAPLRSCAAARAPHVAVAERAAEDRSVAICLHTASAGTRCFTSSRQHWSAE
jgi:hypothetical protein